LYDQTLLSHGRSLKLCYYTSFFRKRKSDFSRFYRVALYQHSERSANGTEHSRAPSAKVNCGKMADWIQMPFGVVRMVGRGMDVLDGGGDRRRGRGSLSFGGEFGASHCNQWGLWDALFSNYFEDLF